MPILCLIFLCLAGSAARAEGGADPGGYELGHGLDLGPFNFAGYGSVVANVPDRGRKALVLDDLSLYVTGHVAKLLNPFVETELTGYAFTQSAAHAPGHGQQGYVVLERLYNDSYLTENFTLRIGKMLAPVGAWNQIHAAPLVLTTVRPAVTQRNFSEYVSGVSVLYSDATAEFPDLQIYAQPDDEFSARPNAVAARRYKMLEGAHLSFPVTLLDKIGFSFQKGKMLGGNDQLLFGTDFHYSIDKFSVEGEWTLAHLSQDSHDRFRSFEWGGYAALSYALSDEWSLSGWYETFTDRNAVSTAHDLLFGVTYRPHPALIGKLEYLQNIGGPPVNPTGLYASWSVLF